VTRPRHVREDGSTLVEVLVAVAILGTSVVAIVGALATGGLGANIARTRAVADVTARTWAESVEAAAFVPCAGSVLGSYSAPVSTQAAAAGLTPSLPTVRYWTTSGFTDACPPTSADVLQLVTLHVAADDRRVGDVTLVVAKRRPS
jgi:Tfp pilus assembly protein PilV